MIKRIAIVFAVSCFSMAAGADVMRCHAKDIVPPDSFSIYLSGTYEFFHTSESQGTVRAVIVEGGLKSTLEFPVESYYHKKYELNIFNSHDLQWPQGFVFTLTRVGGGVNHSTGEKHPVLMWFNDKSYEMSCSYRQTP